MNHAHTILQMAKEQDWFNEVLTVEDTKAISEEVLKTEQQQMPQAFFQREYFCQFREGADQFFKNFRRLVVPVTSRQTEGRKFRLGVDLAKYQDFTVIAPLDLSTFTIGELDRFNGFDYVLQEAKIEAAYHRYNKAVVYIDSTGVGDPIVDHLRVRGIRLEPYKFNEQSRNDLLTNLQILLEQGTIQLPNDEQLLSELESFRYELSDRGRLRIAVPENLHDDSVMAVALAVWNLPAKTVPQEDFWTMHQPFKFKDLTEDWWNGV
jgi:phage FluMu gp28-like protein